MAREMDFVDECYADKDLSLLKKLTLVIPTYNRNYYLSRCLWYHAHFPFGQIIVADSSPEEKKVVNRETVVKVREMFGSDILYLEYEPETEKYGGDIYRKWGDVVMHVETEYTQVCTDKEFVIPTASHICMEYLSSHADYGYAEGGIYNIISHNENSYRLTYRYPNRISSDNENPITRFINSVYSVEPWNNTLLFSVSRTPYKKKIYQDMEEYNIGDIRYGEIMTAYFGHFLGKDEYIDNIVFKIRDEIKLSLEKQVNRFGGTPESSTSRYPKLVEYKLDADCTNSFWENFKACLSKMLDNHQSVNIDAYGFIKTPEFWVRFSDFPSLSPKKSLLLNLWESSNIIRRIYYQLPPSFISKTNKLSEKLIGLTLPALRLKLYRGDPEYIVQNVIESTIEFQKDDRSILTACGSEIK